MIMKVRPGKGAFLLGLLAIGAAVAAAGVLLRNTQSSPAAGATGTLLIYSSTDEDHFSTILSSFKQANPAIRVVYKSLPAREVYDRTRDEIDRGEPGADLVISSSMDLQIKLVNDRYAQAYSSPHRVHLPNWAVWKNEAYAVTSEPIVIGYNKRLLTGNTVPTSHDELAAMLHGDPGRFRNRIGLYDPQQSPTGYMYIRQDLHVDKDNWDLIGGIGRAGPRLFTSTKEMIDRVSAGDLIFAYNIIGSYALQRAKTDPNFGVIVPRDYVLIGSRVALISRTAMNPDAAQQFLDFMLSAEGQKLLGKNNMIPLRSDAARGDWGLGGANERAIHVGPALMADLDRVNQERFFSKWTSSMGRSLNAQAESQKQGEESNEKPTFDESVS